MCKYTYTVHLYIIVLAKHNKCKGAKMSRRIWVERLEDGSWI
ncbi:peroxiredoxin, partial [Bifidobacteriaceae bacterium N170]